MPGGTVRRADRVLSNAVPPPSSCQIVISGIIVQVGKLPYLCGMAKTVRKNFPVEGMGCAACVARVENTLKGCPGVENASVSLASNSAQVDYDPGVTSGKKLREAVQAAGYDLLVGEDEDEPAPEDEEDRRREDAYSSLKRDAVAAAVLAALVMLLAMGFKPFHGRGVAMAVLAGTAVFWCGRRFIVAAWNQARHGSANMDTLVALSTCISFFFSLFNLAFPGVWTSRGLEAHLYFESSAMIVAFILLGRLLEEKAKHGTTAAIRALKGLQPKEVNVRPGDIVDIAPGSRIPADGTVVEGSSTVDESMMTGEPVPAEKGPGSVVYAGTINQAGSFRMRADKTGSETMLAAIICMVQDAQGSKARIQRTVDKVAAVFVPVIIGISLLTLVAWIVLMPGEGLAMGLLSMVTVLVIACPCSLGLATPTAIIAGIGNAASKGILVKDADSLQTARRVDTVVLDKTGTLTVGRIDDLGEDRLKPTSVAAVAELRRRGLAVHMMSGDEPGRAAAIAAEAGVDDFRSRCLPADKADYVSALKAEGHTVAMVGDGINDSAALARADLSVAMGSGTDIAMDAAMVTLVTSDLQKIPQLIDLSRRTDRIIKENLFWAFFYNVLAVPLAAGVLYPVCGFMVSPMVGAACMALSSVCVVCNSLRLRRG